MPRRTKPHPLARSIGRRIRELRLERGLTLEGLANEIEMGPDRHFSRGHLSSMERGLVVPTIGTLAVIADALGVLMADIVNDPSGADRAKLLELTRHVPPGTIRRLVRDLSAVKPTRRSTA